MDALPRPTPTALANEFGPGGDRGEDLADTLGVEGEGTQRHVGMLGRQHHLLDGGNFGGGELARGGAWARRAIVEGTSYGGVAPGVVASRFEAEDLENDGKREEGLRALDGAEDVRLGRAIGESTGNQAEPGGAEHGQEEANDGREDSGSAVEPRNGIEKTLRIVVEGFEGDDRAEATPLPGRDRGARDGEAMAQRRGAGAHHALAQAMVVGATRPRCRRNDGHHHGRITHGSSARWKPE